MTAITPKPMATHSDLEMDSGSLMMAITETARYAPSAMRRMLYLIFDIIKDRVTDALIFESKRAQPPTMSPKHRISGHAQFCSQISQIGFRNGIHRSGVGIFPVKSLLVKVHAFLHGRFGSLWPALCLLYPGKVEIVIC